jgi:hypothetical protein
MNPTDPHSVEAVPTPPPQQVLMQTTLGLWAAQAVATAARLGIADALAQSQPQGSTTLARAVGSVPDMLTWVLDRKREFIAIHEESKDDIMHHD